MNRHHRGGAEIRVLRAAPVVFAAPQPGRRPEDVCVDARDSYQHAHRCCACLQPAGCVEYFDNDFFCDACAGKTQGEA